MHLDSIGACPCPQVEASRKMTLSRLPPVLVLHLKQFSFTNKGSQKLNKPIEYSMELEIPRGEQLCAMLGGVEGLEVSLSCSCRTVGSACPQEGYSGAEEISAIRRWVPLQACTGAVMSACGAMLMLLSCSGVPPWAARCWWALHQRRAAGTEWWVVQCQ